MATATIKANLGISCVVRDMSEAQYYPAAAVAPAYMDVFWHYANESAFSARPVGRFSVGATITIPDNPAIDRDVVVRWITYGADGTPNVSSIEDASFELIARQRDVDAPVITQAGTSSDTLAQVACTISEFTKAKQIQIASNNTFTTILTDTAVDGVSGRATSFYVEGVATQTRYVRVRNSSTGIDGPWSAWSNTLSITFAASGGGGGGSSGDGDPWGGGYYSY